MAHPILDIPMESNDAKAKTIRDYLKALLTELWTEGEGFSGKRPFGNSGWEYDLYRPLLVAKLINGSVDEYGDIVELDEAAADKAILKAIKDL